MNGAERKRLRVSLSRYRQLLALEPEHLGHLEQLARIALALGKPRLAVEYLLRRAEVCARAGEFDTAIADCDSALELSPGHTATERLRAVIVQIVDRHRSSALVQPERGAPRTHQALPKLAPPTRPIEPEPSDLSMPARPFDPPTLDIEPVSLEPDGFVDESVEDLIGPVVDASALLAVYEVDGIDVVPIPTEAPRQPPMPILRPPSGRLFDAIDTLVLEGPDEDGASSVDTFSSGLPPGVDDRATLDFAPDTVPPIAPPLSRAPTHPSLSSTLEDGMPQLVRTDQVEGVLHLGTVAPGPAVAIPDSPLLHALPRGTRSDLVRMCGRIRAAAGDALTQPATQCEGIFVVVFGSVDLYRHAGERPDRVSSLHAGDLLGDMEHVHGGPWRFEAIATEACELLRIDAPVVVGLRQQFPAFDALLRASANRRHAAWLLGANPMFRVLGPNERDLVARRLIARQMAPDAVYCEQGERLDGIGLVASGVLLVSRDGQAVARLGAGRFAGLGALGREGLANARIVTGPRGALIYGLDRAALDDLSRLPAIRDLFEQASRQRA